MVKGANWNNKSKIIGVIEDHQFCDRDEYIWTINMIIK